MNGVPQPILQVSANIEAEIGPVWVDHTMRRSLIPSSKIRTPDVMAVISLWALSTTSGDSHPKGWSDTRLIRSFLKTSSH